MAAQYIEPQQQQKDEKQLRSVFVGNIPYEATEEELREIFGRIGPVLSFRIVFDRETGKPKGYGFCEYRDTETALSAIRNLNGLGLHNRMLRVDSAVNEKGKDEPKEPKIPDVPMFGQTLPGETAEESIIKTMSNLTPDQISEIIQQTAECAKSNPEEAREMLIQNPQLAFALLHGLILTKAIDPKIAHDLIIKEPKVGPDFSVSQIHQHTPKYQPPPESTRYSTRPSDHSQYSSYSERDQSYAPSRIPRQQVDLQKRIVSSPDNKRNSGSYDSDRYYEDRYHDTPQYTQPPQYTHDYSKYDRDRQSRHIPHESYNRDVPSYSTPHNDPRINQRRDRESPPREIRNTYDPRNPPKSSTSATVDPRLHHKPSHSSSYEEHNFDRRDRDYAPSSTTPYHNDPQRFRSTRFK